MKNKLHPIEILLRKTGKKVKVRKTEKLSLKQALSREESVKTLRKVNWNRFSESKVCREFKVTSTPWYSPDSLTVNLNRD